jgi:hypothetical protein
VQPVDLGIPGLTDARLLGSGGFGTVYAATEPEFGRDVAVKVLRDRLDGESARRAFVRECRAMGVLSGHPHIVTVHRGGATATGTSYIVMDLMTGGSLADRGRMPWPEVLDTGVLLAGALETAHRHGVLHLDLKPANVLVSRYGEPKLGDFGISRLPGVAETSGAVRASPAFAAPERLADGTASVSTDLYGFGATLFTLLTGAPAFQQGSGDLIAVLARIVRQPLPDLRGDGVPDAVCRVLETLMAKSPHERYTTAAAAAAALQDAQRATGRPVTRAVIEGAPSATEESAAPTSLALGVVTTDAPAAARPAVTGETAVRLPSAVAAPPPVAARAPAPGWSTREGGPAPAWPPPAGSPPWAPPPGAQPAPAAWAGRPPVRPAAAVVPRRRRVLPVVVAVLVAAAVAGGALAALRPWAGAAVAPTTSAAPPTSTPATPTPGPTTPAGPQAVTLSAGVTGPAAESVRAVLDAYVTAIDDGRYEDAFALFSPDSATARDGLDAWLDAQRPRALTDARLLSVREEGPGTAEAVLVFRSRQDPSYSPDGQQDCLDWELAYTFDGPAPDRLIRSSSTVTDPRPC